MAYSDLDRRTIRQRIRQPGIKGTFIASGTADKANTILTRTLLLCLAAATAGCSAAPQSQSMAAEETAAVSEAAEAKTYTDLSYDTSVSDGLQVNYHTDVSGLVVTSATRYDHSSNVEQPTVQQLQYTYENGRLQQIKCLDSCTFDTSYSYDDSGRVSQISFYTEADSGYMADYAYTDDQNYVETIQYFPASSDHTCMTVSRQFSGGVEKTSQLCSDAEFTNRFDASGNLIEDVDHQYTYSSEGLRLSQTEKSDQPTEMHYEYYPSGALYRTIVYRSGALAYVIVYHYGRIDATDRHTLGTVTVKVTNLNIRKSPSLQADVVDTAPAGKIFQVYETQNADGYLWYRVGDNQWLAAKEGDWTSFTAN